MDIPSHRPSGIGAWSTHTILQKPKNMGACPDQAGKARGSFLGFGGLWLAEPFFAAARRMARAATCRAMHPSTSRLDNESHSWEGAGMPDFVCSSDCAGHSSTGGKDARLKNSLARQQSFHPDFADLILGHSQIIKRGCHLAGLIN